MFFILFATKTLQEAMFLTSLYQAQTSHVITIKIQLQIAKFLTCFGLKLQVKRDLNNLISSIGFQMLKSSSFKWL